jgi:predicted Fe-S protein YdhL (DUF1289 family)
MAKLIRTDRNGTKYYEGYIPCSRCEGRGIYVIGVCNGQLVPSHVDNGICFKCGGSGKQLGKWKEYTPEYEAKLEARRKARLEKKLAEEQAELEARQKEEEARRLEEKKRIEEQNAKLLAEKAKSHYVGTVGERVDIWARYIKTAWFEVQSYMGYGTETMYIHIFKIGNDTLIWKTTAGLGKWNEQGGWESVEEGSQVHLRVTIKEHSEYDGEKQTILTRCKLM